MYSKCTHEQKNNPESPVFIRVSGVLFIIPTRSPQTNLKQICMGNLTNSIYIICIIGKADAIRFFVAISLPQIYHKPLNKSRFDMGDKGIFYLLV